MAQKNKIARLTRHAENLYWKSSENRPLFLSFSRLVLSLYNSVYTEIYEARAFIVCHRHRECDLTTAGVVDQAQKRFYRAWNEIKKNAHINANHRVYKHN